MSPHFFWGNLELDYSSAVKADTSRQKDCSFPRDWYVTATFRCIHCGVIFSFTTDEQKTWYEEYKFFVDSRPVRCLHCRRELRHLAELRQEYDRTITTTLAGQDLCLKQRLAAILDELVASDPHLPDQMQINRKTLAGQIDRLRKENAIF